MPRKRRDQEEDWGVFSAVVGGLAGIAGLYGLSKEQEARELGAYVQRLKQIISDERAAFLRLREDNRALRSRLDLLAAEVARLQQENDNLEGGNLKNREELERLKKRLAEAQAPE
jgi:predicted nuclease with TOPRIM domain